MPMEATLHAAGGKAATRPEFAEILGRVRKLRPEIEARALATEKAKRVSAETMDALRDADVFRMMQPKRFGGYEYGPAELAQIADALPPGTDISLASDGTVYMAVAGFAPGRSPSSFFSSTPSPSALRPCSPAWTTPSRARPRSGVS